MGWSWALSQASPAAAAEVTPDAAHATPPATQLTSRTRTQTTRTDAAPPTASAPTTMPIARTTTDRYSPRPSRNPVARITVDSARTFIVTAVGLEPGAGPSLLSGRGISSAVTDSTRAAGRSAGRVTK